jgi:hypothetical protein
MKTRASASSTMTTLLPGETTLARAIGHIRDCLARRVRFDTGAPLPATFDAATFEKGLDNTFAEHAAYQSTQSHAHAMGTLTTAEAHIIYAALGEDPDETGWASGTDLATKIAVTEVLGHLIKRR